MAFALRGGLLAAVIVLAVLISGCCCIPPLPPEPTPTPYHTPGPSHTPVMTPTGTPVSGELAEWTVMVYLDGDNNLEEAALADFNEIEQVGSGDKVNLVVQLDRSSDNYDGDGDWSGARRYLVQQDDDTSSISTPAIQELGDVDMGDPQTLVDFSAWAMGAYPAKRYALIVWDHGAGWPAVAVDDGSSKDAIDMGELDAALAQIKAQNGGRKLDIIGFDACLMAMFEVYTQVAPYGKVLVASEEFVPGSGWDYKAIATSLESDPQQDARQLAGVMTSSFLTYYETVEKDQTVTLSAMDLERAGALKAEMDSFSGTLEAASQEGKGWTDVSYAKTNAESYGSRDWGYIDLGDFTDIISSFSSDSGVQSAAQGMSTELSNVMISVVHGDQHPHSSGMSIDSSTDAAGGNENYMTLVSAQTTKWTSFLGKYYSRRQSGSSPVSVRSLRSDTSAITPGETLTISGTISGRDIKSADMMVFKERTDENGDKYYVLVDYIEYAPPTYELEDGSTVQHWADGDNPITVEWDGTGNAVEDYEGYIHIAITPIERGSDMYSIEGAYNTTDGHTYNASLVFDMRERSLIYIWNYDDSSEIIPEYGDTFSAETPAFDLEEGSDIFYVSYEELIWGDGGWTVSNRPLEPGNYVLALNAETFYGGSDLQVVDVEVLGGG